MQVERLIGDASAVFADSQMFETFIANSTKGSQTSELAQT
jgi:hypothetical protein